MRRATRASIALAALAAVLAVAGCGSGDGDATLTIYLSAPQRGPAAGDGRDVAAGARLALDDAGDQAGGTPVALEILGDAGGQRPDAARAGANARTATEDSTAIAYIGELDSGATRTSLPITNEAGLLQVSAGASAVDLTRAAPGSDHPPERPRPARLHLVGRVVPSDAAQGAAAAGAMAAAPGIRRVWILGRESPYGESLRFGFDSVTDAPAVAGGGEVDAIYDVSPRPEAGIPEGVGPLTGLYGADAQAFATPPRTRMPRGATIVSGPLAPQQLPASADFADLFRSAYDRPPGRFAAYGYEAMAVVLDAIDRADDPLDRKSVIDSFFATTDRESVLGTYSIDESGDTTLSRVGAYVARADGTLAPAPRPLAVP